MALQTIYNALRAAGLTSSGALGLMGNWWCESNCEACRLQGDFKPDRAASKAYAVAVDSGSMSVDAFMRDAKGWGLAQWTYWSRKRDLYYWCKGCGASIGDELAQVSFAVREMQGEYPAVWTFLTTCGDSDLYQATEMVCTKYERPAFNNISARYQAAKDILAKIDPKADPGKDEPKPQPKPAEKDSPSTPFWPPRMLDQGMIGSDVAVLQAALIARGYSVRSISGIFDASTRTAANKFQQKALGKTGAFGPNSWKALLKM